MAHAVVTAQQQIWHVYTTFGPDSPEWQIIKSALDAAAAAAAKRDTAASASRAQ